MIALLDYRTEKSVLKESTVRPVLFVSIIKCALWWISIQLEFPDLMRRAKKTFAGGFQNEGCFKRYESSFCSVEGGRQYGRH